MKIKRLKSIKSHILYIIIILAFLYFVSYLITKRIKEKDILEDTKEKSIDEIKKIIPYYKTNKGFLRKLENNENKVTIQVDGENGKKVAILSNGNGQDWVKNMIIDFLKTILLTKLN